MRTYADKRQACQRNEPARSPAAVRPRSGYHQAVGDILHPRQPECANGVLQPLRAGAGFMGEGEAALAEMDRAQVGIGENDAGAAAAAPEPAAVPTADAGAAPDAASPGPAEPEAAAPAPAPVPAPAAPVAITSTATVHAPDGTADNRTRIGVCETINFTLGGQVVDWSASNGWPGARPAQATYSWAAPETAGSSTITATDPATGSATTLEMTVVAPERIDFRRATVLGGYGAGTAGAGMTADVRVAPRDVNFGWLAIKEDPRPATNVTGYFAARQAAGANLAHAPNRNFERLNWNSTQTDTAGTVPNTLPGPWSVGTWDWQIPTRYRYFNSTGTGHVFTTAVQRFRMSTTGGVTVTKQSPGGTVASVRRSP